MKKWLLLYVLMTCTLLSGCGPGPADYSYTLAGKYCLFRANSIDISVRNPAGAEVIPFKVVNIAWNDRYIIAEQQGFKNPTSDNVYGEPDNVFYYWMVDTEQTKRYGPYNRATFAEKQKELNIPDSLVLKDVRSYVKPADYQDGNCAF